MALGVLVSGGRLLFLGRGRNLGKPSSKLVAPKPVNLPSLKKESRGFDPAVNIVPAGAKPGWGSKDHDSQHIDAQNSAPGPHVRVSLSESFSPRECIYGFALHLFRLDDR